MSLVTSAVTHNLTKIRKNCAPNLSSDLSHLPPTYTLQIRLFYHILAINIQHFPRKSGIMREIFFSYGARKLPIPLHSIKTNVPQDWPLKFALALCISHLLLHHKSPQNLAS